MASEMASEMAPRHTDAADAALRPALYSALRPAHAPRRGDAAGDIISDLLRRWREACSGGCRASRLCSVQSLLSALLSRYGYTLVVAFATAMLTYPFGFFRSSPQDVTNELFQP
jgi:hypothetical protein